MNVLDLILDRDPQVHLLWEFRCDCAQGDRNPLVCAVHSHQGGRYLYLRPLNARHATTGTQAKRRALVRLLEPGAGFAEIVDCKRCRSHYAVSSAPLASAFLAIRMGPPEGDPFEETEHVTIVKVSVDGALEVLPGVCLTPLDRPTFSQVAAPG